ncbi:MAG: DUF6320 domain-containing protein [Bacilli bacterium]|nr:DUF6320 domain-containing protein [Bacilli bacterium]
MEIKVTYPPRKRRRKFWKVFSFIFNIFFVLAIIVLPLINIWAGGKAWSVVAIFGIYMIWSTFISPSLYELNRTYQTIKQVLNVIIMLILINLLLTDGGWGLTVIPIVSFGGLILCSIMFFSDFNRQKHNAVPFVLITISSIVAGIVGMFSDAIKVKWMFVVLAALGVTVFVISIIFLRKTVFKDLRKQLNTK